MPTVNPRVNVTLKPHQYVLLTRLGKAQGRSRSAILLELLDLVFPVLERVVVALEGAQLAQDRAREGLRESVERAEAAILPHVQAAMGQLDLLVDQVAYPPGKVGERRARPGGTSAPPSDQGSDPRPVTRGSGRGGKRPDRAPLEGLGAAIATRVKAGPARAIAARDVRHRALARGARQARARGRK